MRSLTRSLIKVAATFFSASKRLGFKSRANILPETSIAITISIPFEVFILAVTSVVLGLAKAIINALKANNRNAFNSHCVLVRQVV